MKMPAVFSRLGEASRAFTSTLFSSHETARTVRLSPFWVTANQWVSRAMYAVVKLNIVELVDRQPMTVEQLAAEADCVVDPLQRVMQTLTDCGLFEKDASDRFYLTSSGRQLCKNADDSLHHWTLLLGECWWQAGGGMIDCLRTGKSGFEAVFGKSMWEYYGEHPEQRSTFDLAMNEVTVWQGKVIANSLDFEAVGKMVDIGAGNGSLSCAMLAKHPRLTSKAIDREEAHAALKSNLEKHDLASRCTVLGGSFFNAADIPGDAEAYMIKHVLHDWNDEDVTKILSACRTAMPPTAKLYIIEGLRGRNVDIDFVLDCLDLEQMMVTTGGCERTLDKFKDLLDRSGFRFESVLHTSVADVSVIVAATA